LIVSGIQRLGSRTRGFRYCYAETRRSIRSAEILARIESLKIPPAWAEVHIALTARASLQAIGYDTSGRLQYLYHAGFRERQEREKFDRLLRFAEKLPQMRRLTSEHLAQRTLNRERVLAAMVRLMNAAYFRVGGENYAAAGKVYGIATLRRKHVSISGNTIRFDYTGKWGKQHQQAVTDARLRRIVAQCLALPGHEVFAYYDADGQVRDVKSRDVNAYVKQVMGEEFTAKDFRTWAGTLIAAWKLAELGPAETEREAKKNIVSAIDEVAARLGNTRAIARSSYVSPQVLEHYLSGRVLACRNCKLPDTISTSQRGLSRLERSLVKLLRAS
jgi:DNA topoisomerase-1